MTKVIRLRKGLDIKLSGKAEEVYQPVQEPGLYSLMPDDFTGVTPKVVVKEGVHVLAGEPLFVDKNNADLHFTSPVSGVVKAVERGAKRRVLNIVVEADGQQAYKDYGRHDALTMSGDEVKALLMESGLMAFVRQRPYDVVADPKQTPKAIFVSAFDSAPLAPRFEFVLKGEEAAFQAGLDALSRMAPTHLGISTKQTARALTAAAHVDITAFEGRHPAGNVGVQINHVSPIAKGEIVWTIGAEAVIFIGRLLQTGHVNLTRSVAVTGSEVNYPTYYKLKVGAQLTHVFKGQVADDKDLRYISGNVLTGKQVSADGYLHAFDTQLTVIPEGDETHEMIGWIMPRFNQYSVSRSYPAAWLAPLYRLFGGGEYKFDARIKGGERHMIMSGEYERVLPMDIYPEQLLKAIIAGDIDRMEALGIYEVAPEDFALCEFVCSSKVELQRIVRQGLDMLRAEMA